MGLLPGTHDSIAIGIDDNNRAVGYASTSSGVQTPFMWTEAGGMVNLITQGFPAETPLGISPGGTVATVGHWYHLGDPGSVIALNLSPSGFLLENSTVGINDAGDQARFLVTTVGEPCLPVPLPQRDLATDLFYPDRASVELRCRLDQRCARYHRHGSVDGHDRGRSERSLAGPR
jgi:hypothetical protein